MVEAAQLHALLMALIGSTHSDASQFSQQLFPVGRLWDKQSSSGLSVLKYFHLN